MASSETPLCAGYASLLLGIPQNRGDTIYEKSCRIGGMSAKGNKEVFQTVVMWVAPVARARAALRRRCLIRVYPPSPHMNPGKTTRVPAWWGGRTRLD